MNETHHIYFSKDATSYDFYNNVLSQLHEYFKEGTKSKLVIDFSEVEYISPLVVPNILTVGYILKTYFESPVELLIPWKPKMISYLNDVGFLSQLKNYDLFDVDERFIGDLECTGLYPGCSTYSFEPSMAYEDIRFKLKRSLNIINDLAETMKINVENRTEWLLNILTELCFNACAHSGNLCFATIQTNLIDEHKHKKAYVSISDCGQGLYKTLSTKFAAESIQPVTTTTQRFLNLDQSIKNIYAILESVFYRKNYKIFGLFHVVDKTISNNGIIRMHTDDTQIIFTSDSFKKYVDSPEKLVTNLQNKFNKVLENELEIKYSPVRKSVSRFKGVHIELELPLN